MSRGKIRSKEWAHLNVCIGPRLSSRLREARQSGFKINVSKLLRDVLAIELDEWERRVKELERIERNLCALIEHYGLSNKLL